MRMYVQIVANSEGLPFTVQVAGLPFQDEVVLRVMAMIESEVSGCCSHHDASSPKLRDHTAVAWKAEPCEHHHTHCLILVHEHGCPACRCRSLSVLAHRTAQANPIEPSSNVAAARVPGQRHGTQVSPRCRVCSNN